MKVYRIFITTLLILLSCACYQIYILTSRLDQFSQVQQTNNGIVGTSSTSLTNGTASVSRLSTPPLPSSTEYYSWTGNHWIPPPGIPTYAADDFLAYFRTRNTLFIGDSTVRRAYASLFAAMTTKDTSNVQVKSMDHISVLDVNKNPKTPYRESCKFPDRKFYNSSILCRNLPIILEKNNDLTDFNDDRDNLKKQQKQGQTGKFDYMRINCLPEIYKLFKSNANIEGYWADYDLVVLSSGIWDVLPDRDCGTMYINLFDWKNSNPADYITKILHTLKEASSSELQIAVRTTGFDAGHHHDKVDALTLELNGAILHFFEKLEKESSSFGSPTKKDDHNMVLVDWGSVIRMRSNDRDRIEGDIKAHYGLEARLLFCQQLLHQLRLADKSE